jgi:hypothetical protein
MKKLVNIVFTYEDGTSDMIDDPRAAGLFQSRVNSSGILSGVSDFIVPLGKQAEEEGLPVQPA